MIRDAAEAQKIRDDWLVVRKFCQSSHRQAMAGGVLINETPPDDYYNLALLLAYGVLGQTLGVLRDEGAFPFKGWMLGPLMLASKTALPWQDYAAVEAGKNKRNDLAHEGKVATKADCLAAVDAIERELRAWGVG
jgi:hypothetical protein